MWKTVPHYSYSQHLSLRSMLWCHRSRIEQADRYLGKSLENYNRYLRTIRMHNLARTVPEMIQYTPEAPLGEE